MNRWFRESALEELQGVWGGARAERGGQLCPCDQLRDGAEPFWVSVDGDAVGNAD
jgi:hypothetical protein